MPDMSSEFSVIFEEFDEELEAISAIITAFSDPKTGNPKTRVAAANSATLLLAATFEEFIREMARTYARAVVMGANTFDQIPSRIISTAWKRSMEALSKIRLDTKEKGRAYEMVFAEAQFRFNVVYEFCNGDKTKDIYKDLIHNDNNMRPGEINGLFRVSDLSNICRTVCDRKILSDAFAESDPNKAHGQLMVSLEEFFDRRNQIAHSIAIMRSTSPDLIRKDIDMLSRLGKALCETLEEIAPVSNA